MTAIWLGYLGAVTTIVGAWWPLNVRLCGGRRREDGRR